MSLFYVLVYDAVHLYLTTLFNHFKLWVGYVILQATVSKFPDISSEFFNHLLYPHTHWETESKIEHWNNDERIITQKGEQDVCWK